MEFFRTKFAVAALAIGLIFTACGENPIIPESPDPPSPPSPPNPPEPPIPTVVVDTIVFQIKTTADLDALFKSMPEVQPDTIRNFYDVLVANNLLMESDGAGNFDANTLNLMTKFGDLATGNRKDQRVKGMTFGGKAPGDGDDKFIFANNSIHITPAIWAQMKKPAMGGENFWASPEDANGFDPFTAILRIIQSASGSYTILNSKAVIDNIGKIEEEINSGKTPIIDLGGDLETNNVWSMTLERFVEILKDGKANKTGVLRFYASTEVVQHNLEFLENLAATNGVIVQKDGWIYVRNIGPANLPMLEKILENGARIRTNKGTNLEHTDRFIADNYDITEDVAKSPEKLSRIPKWKSGEKTILTVDGGAFDEGNDAMFQRIGQKSVNGTPAFPNPDILIRDRNGYMTDIPYRKMVVSTMDDSISFGIMNRIIGHYLMCADYAEEWQKRIKVQVTNNAIKMQFYTPGPQNIIKWDGLSITSDDTPTGGRVYESQLIHLNYSSFKMIIDYPITNLNGEEAQFSMNLDDYTIIVPDEYMRAALNSGGGGSMTWNFAVKGAFCVITDANPLGVAYAISESDARARGKTWREFPLPIGSSLLSTLKNNMH